MPTTALNHFQQDLERASTLVAHAGTLAAGTPAQRLLRDDVLRTGWMFAVGALDAFFCDAYTDVVAATLISKSRQPGMTLPDFFYEIRFPVQAILEPYTCNVNWRWRMAARKLMEREAVLSLRAIQDLFNKFFDRGRRFFGDLLPDWMIHSEAHRRLFGISRSRFAALTPAAKRLAADQARELVEDRFQHIFQRRHDCIHNCDRPRVAPQPIASPTVVLEVVEDVEFLVRRCDEHINVEFREFLLRQGCSAATVRQAGY